MKNIKQIFAPFFKKRNSIRQKINSIRQKSYGTVVALCVDTYDNLTNKNISELKKGKLYTVEYAVIGTDSSLVYLKELENRVFNSVLFKYYINGMRFEPVYDARPLCKIAHPESHPRNAPIIKYPKATDSGLIFLRNLYTCSQSPVIERRNPGKEIELPKIPDFNIDKIIDFAQNGWTLDETHGLLHWQKVERNAIVLSLEICNDAICFRKDVNLKVVRSFAYLHDKCRLDNGADIEHGARSAEMLSTIRDTILNDFTDEEFSLLERACKYHTSEHCTGDPTIDVCFDADRLDLVRIGIEPNPKKMATPQGAYYAYRFRLREYSTLFRTYYEMILNNVTHT